MPVRRLGADEVGTVLDVISHNGDQHFTITDAQYAAWHALHPDATPGDVENLVIQTCLLPNRTIYVHCFSVDPLVIAVLVTYEGYPVDPNWWENGWV